MKEQDLKIMNKKVSVVFLGAFNPVMFQPIWFKDHNIINPSEIDSSINQKKCFLTPDITIFSTDQFDIRIENNRFSITSKKEPFLILKDTIKKTFLELGGIPIKAMGINSSAHYILPDMEMLHKIGDIIAPKQYWKKLLKNNIEGNDRKGGLLEIRMSNNKENNEGSVNVFFTKSSKFDTAIFIETNDHYQFNTNIDIEQALIILDKNFEVSQQNSFDIQKSLFEGLYD